MRRKIFSWNVGGLSGETKVELDYYLQRRSNALGTNLVFGIKMAGLISTLLLENLGGPV